MKPNIILTCEHGGNEIPGFLKNKINIPANILKSHYALDPGALALAKSAAKALGAKLFYTKTSRLVVDTNRALDAKSVFSGYSKSLPENLRNKIVDQCYLPYRHKVESYLQKHKGPTLVLSIHSFTPKYKGKTRSTDIGILYRTTIAKEKRAAHLLQKNWQKISNMNVHLNRPYRGHTDCFLNDLSDQYLRKNDFVGLFIEINMDLLRDPAKVNKISSQLVHSIQQQLPSS